MVKRWGGGRGLFEAASRSSDRQVQPKTYEFAFGPGPHGRRWPTVLLGRAPSDRGQQRPPRLGCLIPCHPVSPVALPGRAKPCSYYTFYYIARRAKGPLRDRKGP